MTFVQIAFKPERLRNVVKALRESPSPEEFTMEHYAWDCGTPGCALGHYAYRTDLQDAFFLDESGTIQTAGRGCLISTSCFHFGITAQEEIELFSSKGCGVANTAEQAALYIENFIQRKLGEQA